MFVTIEVLCSLFRVFRSEVERIRILQATWKRELFCLFLPNEKEKVPFYNGDTGRHILLSSCSLSQLVGFPLSRRI